MKSTSWQVDGVHHGKKISELPVTYLLWFIGSHQMRRSRWGSCRLALGELRARLLDGPEGIEYELLDDLRSKTSAERGAIKARAQTHLSARSK